MPSVTIDEDSTLARVAARSAVRVRRPLAAARFDDRAPTLFVADEVLVNAEDRDLVEELESRGGEVIPDPPLPPPRIDESGRPFLPEVDMTGAPVALRVRFREAPAGDIPDLGEAVARDPRAGDRLAVSSRLGASIAAVVTGHRADGRRIGLNAVGQEFSMPLATAQEGPGLVYGADPFQWTQLTGQTRIVDAWQLVESVRQVRGGAPVFVCISDQGFWLDGGGVPQVAPGQPASDFGAGVLQWNLAAEGSPATGTSSGGGFHGNAVASAALAAVGNLAGAAGAGGTVALPAFFFTRLTAADALRCLRLCTWWGIGVVNLSWGFWGQSELWFDTDTWDDTFNWAADNGLISIAAAGNSALELPDDENIRPATRTPRTLTVGALASDDTARSTSNFGSSVDIWAPGSNINVAPDANSPAGSQVNGTSFAAPVVAGTAAMMRFCNPGLGADEVRQILTATAWPGSGRVTRGLDAYAAVWEALRRSLPDTNEENDAPDRASRLLPVGPGGSLAPGFGAFSALSDAGDRDYYAFDVDQLSAVAVTVEWYRRIANLRVAVHQAEQPLQDADLAAGGDPAAGRRTLDGLLPPGAYRVRITGTDPTAYRLTVAVREPHLAPDMFELNDTVATASRLIFEPRTHPWLRGVRPEWGPGTFDATLHRTFRFGLLFMDVDHYLLDVPQSSVFRVPTVAISDADEPVDVVLLDAAQNELDSWSGVRSLRIEPPPDSECFLRVSGPRETRYRIGTGLRVREGVLPGPLREELELVPKYWGDPPPFRLRDRVAHFAVDIAREEQADGVLAFAAEGESLHVELLDERGDVVRAGRVVDDRLVVDVEGIDQGTHVLRAVVRDGAAAPGSVTLRALPPPM